MEGIADFLDSFVAGIDLVFFSLCVGSLCWALFVLQPWKDQQHYPEILLKKTISLLIFGLFALFFTQVSKIFLKIWLMSVTLDTWPFPAFAETIQFQAGLWRAFFIAILGLYSYVSLRKNPYSKSHWNTAAVLAIPIIFSGAWLVHGAGRFDNRIFLMTFTVIHQVAAAAWVGGVFQLVSLWLLRCKNLIALELWPLLLQKFSMLGKISILIILASGIPMALQYITTINGFIGTGYGNLLLVKIILLCLALGFAWLNHNIVVNYFQTNKQHAIINRVPYYIEAETFVLITLLFTAASLASQPPAIDISDLTATWREVINTFTPRIPRITSPSNAAFLAGEAGRVAIIGQTPSEAATAWSDYNHNIAGIFLTAMSFFAMLSYTKLISWAKYWPVGFIGLAMFLLLRSDAESWPLGPLGFWESTFHNGETLQHRIATLLVFTLGIMELRARMTTDKTSKLPYIFPYLAAFGGLMLLTHSHVGFQAKTAYLIQVGHTLMGIFSLILAIGRWLELKLDNPGKKIAGFISVFSLFQIGLILMFYREPLF
jgi:putative copper resistance protein D